MSIKLISEMTGISYATVARALSGNGYCSKEKRDIIAKAAEEIHYHPNLSARTLRNNRTEKILLGSPDICNAFYFRIFSEQCTHLQQVVPYLVGRGLCRIETFDDELFVVEVGETEVFDACHTGDRDT